MTAESLIPRLCALRRRLIAQAFVERLARALMCALLVGLLLSVAQRLFDLRVNWRFVSLAGVALAASWSIAVTLIRAPSLPRTAGMLDRLGATRDRWTSALAFISAPFDSTRELALRECAAWLKSRDFRPLLPWRVPRAFTWSIVPLVAIGFMQWQLGSERLAVQRDAAMAQEELAPRIRQLEALADSLDQAQQEHASAEVEKLAEQIRKSVESLRGEVTPRNAASKAALRELSRLEQLIREMQESPARLSQEELDALAKALEQQPETAPAADALKQGRTADAAEALERAARKLAETKDQPASQQAGEVLRQAMERLAQQRQLSEALREIARQLSQRTGPGSESRMLRQLGQMLRESKIGQAGHAPKPGARDQKQAQQFLQRTLAALQNMKHGEQPGKPPETGGREGEGGQVLVQSFGKPEGSDSSPGALMAPTGVPGSERDSGTTKDPFGSGRSEIADKGGEMVLRGQLGEGETLSQMIPSTGGNDKAHQRYREIYEAMAPAAEEAILQEDIPLGSRFLIKRYFESIRP